MIRIKIRNLSDNPMPEYATTGSSGMDVRAHTGTPLKIEPMERIMVPTGLYMEIPAGYEVQVRPRSGMAWKQGITCLNSPGTVDSDYRGELRVILINLSSEIQTINPGDRIAQLVVAGVEKAVWEKSEELSASERGAGGFGHTGIQ